LNNSFANKPTYFIDKMQFDEQRLRFADDFLNFSNSSEFDGLGNDDSRQLTNCFSRQREKQMALAKFLGTRR
jgi:hypothetical protein